MSGLVDIFCQRCKTWMYRANPYEHLTQLYCKPCRQARRSEYNKRWHALNYKANKNAIARPINIVAEDP